MVIFIKNYSFQPGVSASSGQLEVVVRIWLGSVCGKGSF